LKFILQIYALSNVLCRAKELDRLSIAAEAHLYVHVMMSDRLVRPNDAMRKGTALPILKSFRDFVRNTLTIVGMNQTKIDVVAGIQVFRLHAVNAVQCRG